jgi:hypothetical protein
MKSDDLNDLSEKLFIMSIDTNESSWFIKNKSLIVIL